MISPYYFIPYPPILLKQLFTDSLIKRKRQIKSGLKDK